MKIINIIIAGEDKMIEYIVILIIGILIGIILSAVAFANHKN